MPEYNKVLLITSQEIIKIDKSSFAIKIIANIFLPAKCRGLTTHIPTIFNFKLRYAKKERRTVDQRIANQKIKTGFNFYIFIVYFNIKIAYFHYDNTIDNSDYWSIFPSFILINEKNCQIIFNDFTLSLLSKASIQAK